MNRDAKGIVCAAIIALLGTVVVPSAGAATGEGVYVYDDAGRLVSASYDNSKSATYVLDNAGNRVSVISAAAASAGILQFNTATASVAENVGTLVLTVTRTGGSLGSASVTCSTTNGTAVAGADYTAVSTLLTWNGGDTSAKTCSIPILVDVITELSEDFTVSLSGASGAAVGSVRTVRVTILDGVASASGRLQFASSSYSIAENGGSLTVSVTRTGGSLTPASVNYTTKDISARSGFDYTAASGTLNWSQGDSGDKTFSIPVRTDALTEGNETFAVALTGAVGAVLGTPASSTITIIDVDVEPPSGVFLLTLSAPQSTRVDISWSASTDNFAVTGYLIERCTGASCTNFVQIGTTSVPSYSDMTTSGTTTYGYRARATDAAGNLSSYSPVANYVTTPDTIAPSPPANLAATPINSAEIDLSWSAALDVGGGGCCAYHVYRDGVELGAVGITTFADTGLAANTTYSYRIVAADNAANSSTSSATVSAITAGVAPGVPQNLDTNPSVQTTTTGWTVLWNVGTGPIVRYELQEKADNPGFSAPTQYNVNVPTTTQAIAHGAAARGHVWYYRIRACTADGTCSAWSSSTSLESCAPIGC